MISDKSLGNQGPWPVPAGAPGGPWQWLLHLLCSCRAGRLKTLEVGTHLPLASSQVTPPGGVVNPLLECLHSLVMFGLLERPCFIKYKNQKVYKNPCQGLGGDLGEVCSEVPWT